MRNFFLPNLYLKSVNLSCCSTQKDSFVFSFISLYTFIYHSKYYKLICMICAMRQDVNGRGDWWLKINNRDFGYWPSSIFSILSDSAASVRWGGEVLNYNSEGQHTTTQMGSGHLAEEGPRKASFFKNLNVIDGLQILRGPRKTTTVVTNPNCYSILTYGGLFYYGGPGRNPNCP